MPTTVDGNTGVSQVQDGSIQTADIVNGAVTAAKLSGLTVTQANQPTLPAAGTTISFLHGLGTIPVSAELEAVCLTAELGYSVGDVVNPWFVNASYGAPPVIRRTTTTVSATPPNNINIANATTGLLSNPTLANWAWRFKVRAA